MCDALSPRKPKFIKEIVSMFWFTYDHGAAFNSPRTILDNSLIGNPLS